tara:strand:+ start:1158 stop:1682 length:525 start_codon:yes stop_codon:yes gene_type:complete
MRRVSLNARTAFDEASTDQVEVALIMIEHPALDAPLRLSTDPTERLSIEPFMYGTRSAWMDSLPISEPFLFVLASADLPSDLEDAPAAATIVIENVDSDIAGLMRSFTDRPTVNIAVVMAETPDLVEVEYRGMVMTGASGTANEISIEVSRAPIEEESVPMDRFTKDRFPGMFR